MSLVALDTNLLVYAFRSDLPEHEVALDAMQQLVRRGDELLVTPIVAVEFLRVVTHPRLANPAAPLSEAHGFLADLLASDAVSWSSARRSWQSFSRLVERGGPAGNAFYDLEVAAAALDGGATSIVTNDRRFVVVPGLSVVPMGDFAGQ